MEDFSKAVVVRPPKLSGAEENAIRVLVEEVEKRTNVRLPVRSEWPGSSTTVIAVGPVSELGRFAGPLQLRGSRQERDPEGFRLMVQSENESRQAWVIGNDARGVLFGVGRLLREMRLSRDRILLPTRMDITTAPVFPLRGHQLGYRPKTNSYDGFTAEIWEQYIRELAVFGTNAIELMPPRTDDAADSPHFPIPQMEMMVQMSAILDQYGLDVWIWYPALDQDYSDPATVEFALKEWGEVFRRLPRIDAVFVPGGDPGHTQPKYLMQLLEKQTQNLHRYHPDAEMWMSPQGFTGEWMQEYYAIMREEPEWLTGVVFGPQVPVSLPELRKSIPERYPIRRYPDITHSLRCQYPVPDWDVAYALTEQREVINPRPTNEAVIFRTLDEYAPYGFLTYSEGVNDDVNKMIWSGLGWDPETPVSRILQEYSRYFLGPEHESEFAQGLLDLEQNWKGPLLTNDSVYSTLAKFQTMENRASPALLQNWRFQQALYRAYYDAYVRSRLIYETELEERALEVLRNAGNVGSLEALNRAERILEKAEFQKVSRDWRQRVFQLAEALFQSIRMQLSVDKYQAISVGRGANLDLIDYPLNSRFWLMNQFSRIRGLEDEKSRREEISNLASWTNPGPGGFYDDLGNLTNQSRLVHGPGYPEDPAFLRSSLVGFACTPDRRISWCRHAESLHEAALQMRYENLDPAARYKIRVVYAGDNFRAKVRLRTDEGMEIHDLIEKPRPIRPIEFNIPQEATKDGELILLWTREPGLGGNGRGAQVAEVWLMKME